MFLQKKKNQPNSCGPIIGLTATQDVVIHSSCSFLVPIIRALLCLLLALGSVCGFASSFGAEFSFNMVFIVLLSCSLILAYVKNLRSNLLKNLFFIAFFIAYAYFIFQYYTYVNSGYHSVINLTYASLENYLNIPALVYYEEIIENSYIPITLFLIFWGIFELFLYHMWTTNQLRFLSIFLVSLAPLSIPFFINRMPDNLYIFFLLWAYACCLILKNSHHNKVYPQKKQNFKILRHANYWSFSHKGFSYGMNGLNILSSFVFSFILSLVILLLVTVVIPYPTYQRTDHTSSLKESVTDDVKYFVMFGFSGYFNQYNATGGMSDGRLGGIHSVRPDYETDLVVRMVPLSYDTIYLRGYVGIGYTDRKWLSTLELVNNDILSKSLKDEFIQDTMLQNEFDQFDSSFLQSNTMKITNKGASFYYPYSPYYTSPRELTDLKCYNEDSPYNFYHNTKTYHYYPDNYIDAAQSASQIEREETSTAMLTACLQVPDATYAEIVKYLIDNDLCTNYIVSPGTYSELSQETLSSILEELSDHLTNDFTYSMNPGITSHKEDFVGSFLNRTKKGYCAHFATSAALILRSLGIPTRYVEGYVVTYDDITTATLINDETPNDYVNTSLINMNLHVMDVEIGDDKAHAWLEYYDPDFGWRVFEATTAASEQFESPNFLSSLYGFLNQTRGSSGNIDINANADGKSIAKILYNLLIGLVVIIVLIVIGYYSYRFTRQYRSYHRNRDNINVRNLYKLVAKNIERRYPEFAYIVSMKDQFTFITEHYKLNKAFTPTVIKKLISILEQSAFSKDAISSTEAAFALKLLHLLRRNILLNIRKRPGK